MYIYFYNNNNNDYDNMAWEKEKTTRALAERSALRGGEVGGKQLHPLL